MEEENKNKLYIIIILLLILVILLLLLLFVVAKNNKNTKKEEKDINFIVKKLQKNSKEDKLKILIKKAHILYNMGKKEEALKLLEKISYFSKNLSYYNLGVVSLKEHNYKKALEYFQKAIDSNQTKALSAINAAYASLKLKNKKLFNYYKKLAYLYLPTLSNNKNYYFYYAIVMYYMGYEYEALTALNKSDYKSNNLKSLLYEYLKDPFHASIYEENPLYKGLELAQIGKYQLATNYLKEDNSSISKFALGLVDLKISNFKEASKIFQQLKNKNIYPIYTYLKPSLFDIKTAQKEFKKNFLSSKKDFYDLFFHYTPYKLINVNKNVEILQKGLLAIPVGEIQQAKTSLSKSAYLSTLNLNISKALQLAIKGHVYLANKKLQKLYETHKNSYTINYNLALTYAKLGEYKKSYFHFIKAYHLNPNDIKSGILALFLADKLNITNPNLSASIKENLTDESLIENAMLSIYLNDKTKMKAFLEKNESTPYGILTKLIIKALFKENYTNEAYKLNLIFKKDLITKLLYFYSQNKNIPIKELSKKYQALFFKLTPYLDEFFYGGKLPNEWFFKFAKISGLTERVRLILIKKAKTQTKDIIPILKKLAFASFYTKHFEEAYTMYNDLIENKNINDPYTLYYAALSAIGANHHNNAIALMELAKLKNPLYPEPRFALGLLWQEKGNLNAASIQYKKLPNTFKSKFFDFNIKRINE